MEEDKEVKQEEISTVSPTRKGVFQTNYLVYYVLGLIESVLILRLIFKLLGANPDSGFVNFIYSVSGVLVAPFTAIFPVTTSNGVVTTSVLEPATIIAAVIYALIAWGISALVKAFVVGRD